MSRNYRFFRGNFGHNIKSSGGKICGQRRLLLTDGKLSQRALHQCKPFSLNKAALSKKFYTSTNNSTCMPFLPLEAGYRQNIHVLYCPQIFEEKNRMAQKWRGMAWASTKAARPGKRQTSSRLICKSATLHVQHTCLVHFFIVTARAQREISRFIVDANPRRRFSFLFLNFLTVLENSTSNNRPTSGMTAVKRFLEI